MTNTPGKILIVDDEEVIRKLLHQKLTGEGYHCEEACNAGQAVAKLLNDSFELVILDISMPGKSGVELLPEIRLRYPDIAVIMATAINDTNIAIQCMKQGAYDYFTKPFSLDEVILSVARTLEKRRLELENRDYQQHLEQRVEAQARRIRASFLSAVTALAYALEVKDRYTSGHSQRVAEISVTMGKALSMPQKSIEKVRLAGLIHDIGKIGIRESVLNKPSRLTEEEFQHVKCHPEIGEHILNPIVDDEEILMIVRHHHERYDGNGYPDRLSSEQIPLGARILAVADSYDAMTSERPYRKAMSTEMACAEVERCTGTQFDPEAAEAFLRTRNLVQSSV
jgi:response regulator RpfG family c-di-GMP phosphodiesterase